MATLARTLTLAACLAACLAPAASADSLYWSSYTPAGAIRTGALGGTAQTLLPGESSPQGVALDPAGGRIFWTDYGANAIREANLDGTGAHTLFTETKPTGIAFDPATQKLYWNQYISDSSGAVRVGNADGSGTPQNLYPNEGAAQGLVIDPSAGRIYWTSYAGFKIRAGSLDGSAPATTLFGATSPEYYPTGLAVDDTTNTLYWVDETAAGLVRAGSTTGGTPRTVYPGLKYPGGLALDASTGRLFWGESNTGNVVGGTTSGSAPGSVFGGETTPWYVAILRAPQGTSAPAITGSGGLGQKLSCSGGGWAADDVAGFLYRAPRSFAYQWFKDGTAIDGAATNAYTPFAPGNYACRVTAGNAGGSSAQSSAPVGIGAGTTAPPPQRAGKPKPISAGYSFYFAWNARTRRNTLTIFKFSQLPKAARLELRCHGAGCTFKRKRIKPHRTSIDLRAQVKRLHLKPGDYIEARISAPKRITEVLRFTARGGTGGKAKRMCLPAGAKTPRRCS